MIDAKSREGGRTRPGRRRRGTKALTGGSPSDGERYFYPPMALTNVPVTARILREEVFGPVAPVVSFSTEAEAIALANDSPASSPTRWPRSAASSSPAWAAKAAPKEVRSTSRPDTSASRAAEPLLVVQTSKGGVYRHQTRVARGAASNRLPDAETLQKFAELAGTRLAVADVERIADQVLALEDCGDVSVWQRLTRTKEEPVPIR